MSEHDSHPSAATITRRRLARGAAWATPALVAGVAAPALAVSADCAPQTAAAVQRSLAFDGSIGNWTQSRSPATAPQVSYQSTYNSVSNAAVLTDDPTTTDTSTTTLLSPPACLSAGRYTFTFDSALYNNNPRPVQLTADAVNATTGAVVGSSVSFTTTTGPITGRTGDVVTVVVTERTQIRFRYRWIFAQGNDRVGDDIGVTAPRVATAA